MIKKKKIAVIGSGISGLSAAYLLKDHHDVTVYEKNDRLGGHSRTLSLTNDQNQKIDVDTGFIVLNDRTYPNLNKLFKRLAIEIEKTEMSFAISVNQGQLEWSGTSADSFFAQKKNLLNLKMLGGMFDIAKFNKKALEVLDCHPGLTLSELIQIMKLGSWFRDYYILPMGGAIWSCSYKAVMDFPAATFVNFFHNHGLLSLNHRPQWYTLKNKSIDYVQAIEKSMEKSGVRVKKAELISVTRQTNAVCIQGQNHGPKHFDDVIFACHPADILKILTDVSGQEKNILLKFNQQKNIAYTHRDINQMPKIKKCWSSWNYLYSKGSENKAVSLTYWMNKLQNIKTSSPLFVTLNPVITIPDDKIYDVHDFYHPIFDHQALDGQRELKDLQGVNKTWFCGAYLKYGFHEDGVKSSIDMVQKMDETIPW